MLERASGQSFWTEADGISIVILAQGIQSAGIWHTRIESVRYLLAADVRIALISWKARALCLVIAGDAFRVFTAVKFGARVDTLSVESVAILVRRTVFVVLANILAIFSDWRIVRH